MIDNETMYDQDDTPEVVEENVEETPEQLDEAGQQVDAAQAAPEPVEQKPTETAGQKNFRMMREKADRERMQRERAERERDQAVAILRDIEMQALARKNQHAAQREDDDYLDDDSKKLHKEIRDLRRIQEQQMQQSHNDQIERRLRKEYTDFDDIMTEDNIATFARNNPRDAQLIRGASDLYLQASATYDGIQRMMKEQGHMSQDRMKLAANAKKPRATGNIAPVSQSPLANLANGGKVGPQDLERIRSITQGYINKRPSE